MWEDFVLHPRSGHRSFTNLLPARSSPNPSHSPCLNHTFSRCFSNLDWFSWSLRPSLGSLVTALQSPLWGFKGLKGRASQRGCWQDVGREGGCQAGPTDCQENDTNNIADLPSFSINTPSINPLKIVLLCSELCSGLYIAIN